MRRSVPITPSKVIKAPRQFSLLGWLVTGVAVVAMLVVGNLTAGTVIGVIVLNWATRTPTDRPPRPTATAIVEVTATPNPTSTRRPATRVPTSTPRRTSPPPTKKATNTATATPTRNPQACAFNVTGHFSGIWEQYRKDLGCPFSASEKAIQDAEQMFQNGHLFWRADIDRYYAVYDAGGATSGGWAVYSRKNGAIQNCPQDAPSGYWKPTSGFGDVWCVLGGVNSSLGWAVDHEYGFLASQGIQVQDFEFGAIFRDSDSVRRNLVYVFTKTGFYRVTP